MMNKRMLALVIVAFSTLLLTSTLNAQGAITAWVDKQKYNPGDKGTLYIAFLNSEDFGVRIENVTITYDSWQAYKDGDWVGNETQTIGADVGKGSVYRIEISFTVPDDGRAKSTYVDVRVGTDFGYQYESYAAYIEVSETPSYMEQIITLFTIQVVLLIVCTAIIAGTIFLTARRPHVTWKAEEKQ
jgi:hypothetical protein